MKIAVYGGSFNPPHLGHTEAALSVSRELMPELFLIVPDNIPPHKDMAEGSPSPEQRMELCSLAFERVPGAHISDMELKRQGKSYTADTVAALKEQYPGDSVILVIGSDMLLSFEQWHRCDYLLENCVLAVLSREEDDRQVLSAHAARLKERAGGEILLLPNAPLPMSSSQIREKLRLRLGSDMLDDGVYSLIIKKGWYEALPELGWLRQKAYAMLSSERLAHVAGCESEAVLLARRWGEDPETAATAGILHDITKKLSHEQQLLLCEKYGIILDKAERSMPSLLHARTGAALAVELFGVSEEICRAIRFHTTGRPDMSLLEKIIYLADYIEPTRDFPGLDRLRELAYKDLDKALALGLEMSLEELRGRGIEPYKDTVEAYLWYSATE